ncbi:minor capsid protein, partial [Staphylococcus capitis]
CHTLNGKVFKVKDMVPGINAPPMHPWCRSTTVPHVGNWRDKFFTERKGKYQIKDYLSDSGALSNKNDEYGVKRRKHAQTYYNSVKNRDKLAEIKTIANNVNMNEKAIKRVYEHLFENKYLLDNGIKQFDPDFYMAQSWQRLREGKNIKSMDVIMLKHEALEHFLMNKYYLSYKEAHILSEKNTITAH